MDELFNIIVFLGVVLFVWHDYTRPKKRPQPVDRPREYEEDRPEETIKIPDLFAGIDPYDTTDDGEAKAKTKTYQEAPSREPQTSKSQDSDNDCALLANSLNETVKAEHRHHKSIKNLKGEGTSANAYVEAEKQGQPRLPKGSLAAGIVMAEILGKPRALKPLREERY